MGVFRSTARAALVLGTVLVVLAVLPLLRRPLLRSAGALLVYEDPLQHADVGVITAETGDAGELEAADLFRDHVVPRVAALVAKPREAEIEMARRGIRKPDVVDVLSRLGVPASAVDVIDAGEGGTTEGTAALAAWCRARRIHRLLVIVSPHHATRVRRALVRAFPRRRTTFSIRITKYDAFRAGTWWQSRTTARDGIVELEKLLLDYAMHPFERPGADAPGR
jgi:hypothetical protein